MSVQTDIQLQSSADIIRNESAANANTAIRVGNMLKDIVENKPNITDLATTNAAVTTANTNATAAATAAAAASTAAGTKVPLTYLDTDVTLAANSDVKFATQKAAKAYSDTKLPQSYLDTDITLAANSDTKLATQKAVKAYVTANAGAKGYLELTGFLSQSATSAPNLLILKNDFLGTISTQRSSVGNYYIQNSLPEFVVDKTVVFITMDSFTMPASVFAVTNNSGVKITTRNSTVVADNMMGSYSIHIRTYP